MNSQELLLIDFARELNLELSQTFLSKAKRFCEVIIEANKATNLVSKKDSEKLLTRHVADSLMFAVGAGSLGSQASLRWLDFGAGAGFPVIPLCIFYPGASFFAVEPRKKRCEFLLNAKKELDLQNLEIIEGSAERCGVENVDIVSCRAVGSLEEDFDRARLLMKSGGKFITVKSERNLENQNATESRILKNADIRKYSLPLEEQKYVLISVKMP